MSVVLCASVNIHTDKYVHCIHHLTSTEVASNPSFIIPHRTSPRRDVLEVLLAVGVEFFSFI